MKHLDFTIHNQAKVELVQQLGEAANAVLHLGFGFYLDFELILHKFKCLGPTNSQVLTYPTLAKGASLHAGKVD